MKSIVTVYQRADDKWAWRIQATNGQVIATDGSQGYENENDAREIVNNLVEGEYGTTLDALRDTSSFVLYGSWIAEQLDEGDIVPGYGTVPGSDMQPIVDLTKLPGWNDLVKGILAGEIRAIDPKENTDG